MQTVLVVVSLRLVAMASVSALLLAVLANVLWIQRATVARTGGTSPPAYREVCR